MKTILVPTDFSGRATEALVTAASISRTTGGRIVLMHNVETLVTNWSHISETERTKYPDILRYTNQVRRKLREMTLAQLLNGLVIETLITYGVTSDEILRVAINVNADLIVMGSDESKKSRRDFIGSAIQKVVRQTSCPVLLIKKEIEAMKWKKVLVPVPLDFDISVPFEELIKIPTCLGSVIQLLYVNTPQHFKTSGTAQKLMNEFKAKYPALPIATAVYDHTQVEEGILEFAEVSEADYIAMVTFEHKHAPGYQLSVTDYILHHATVPVLATYEGVGNRQAKKTAELA